MWWGSCCLGVLLCCWVVCCLLGLYMKVFGLLLCCFCWSWSNWLIFGCDSDIGWIWMFVCVLMNWLDWLGCWCLLVLSVWILCCCCGCILFVVGYLLVLWSWYVCCCWVLGWGLLVLCVWWWLWVLGVVVVLVCWLLLWDCCW